MLLLLLPLSALFAKSVTGLVVPIEVGPNRTHLFDVALSAGSDIYGQAFAFCDLLPAHGCLDRLDELTDKLRARAAPGATLTPGCPPLDTKLGHPCQLAGLGSPTYRPADTLERWSMIEAALGNARRGELQTILEYGSGRGFFSLKLAHRFRKALVLSAEVNRNWATAHARALALPSEGEQLRGPGPVFLPAGLVCNSAFLGSPDAAPLVRRMLEADCYPDAADPTGAMCSRLDSDTGSFVDVTRLLGDHGGSISRSRLGGARTMVDVQLLLSVTHWWGMLERDDAVRVHGQLFALAATTFLELPAASNVANGAGGRPDQTKMLRQWYPAGSDEQTLIEDALDSQGIRKFAVVRLLGQTSTWGRKLWRIDYNLHGLRTAAACETLSRWMGCNEGQGGVTENGTCTTAADGAVAQPFLRRCQVHMMRHGDVLLRDTAAEASHLSDGLMPKASLILSRGPSPCVAKLNTFATLPSQSTRTPGLTELMAGIVGSSLGFSMIPMTGRWIPCSFVPEFRAGSGGAQLDKPWEAELVKHSRGIGACLAPVTIIVFEKDLVAVELPASWERNVVGRTRSSGGCSRRSDELGALLIFDFLVQNPDRWNGRNLKAIRGGSIVFHDNDRAFLDSEGLLSTALSLFDDPVAVPEDCVCVSKTVRSQLARPRAAIEAQIVRLIRTDPLAGALGHYFDAVKDAFFLRLERMNTILATCRT